MRNKKDSLKYLIYEARPTHWIKNLIIFLPLIFAEKALSLEALLTSCYAFIFFSFMASAAYIFNDLIDLPRDRQHPFKKLRPLARGRAPRSLALNLALALIALSLTGSSFLLNQAFTLVLIVYLLINLSYTFFLKRIVIVDVLTIAAFYILRAYAGIVALRAPFSHWMILCVGLLALFLAFNKRRTEIRLMGHRASRVREVLVGYDPYFIDQMVSVVTAATVVSYTLYTLDQEVISRVGSNRLFLTTPFVYYGIFRYLYLIHRRKLNGDPIHLFLSDRMMVLNVLLWILTSFVILYL